MKTPKINWIWLRRISQILFLILFLFLFRKTDYTGSDEIPYAVNIFFRWDPLIAASVMLAAKEFIKLLFPAIVVLVITIVLGRVFCGWLCPMGTLLDGFSRVFPKKKRENRINISQIKYLILIVIVISAIFGLQIVGYFDPFSILVRGFTFLIDPIFNLATTSFFDFLYNHAPEVVTSVSEPIYSFLKSTILPYKQSFYTSTVITFLILFGIFVLEAIDKRFWCRNLCPLGGFLAIISRFSLIKRKPKKVCTDCQKCAKECKMDAFNRSGYFLPEECNMCMSCAGDCPKDIISYSFKKSGGSVGEFNLSRRVFVGAAVTGIVLPLVGKVSATRKKPNPYLLRPPGALDEDEFLSKCVRCGECMKVCINNALHPAFFEGGFEAGFTPKLVPRIGYCEFNCTLCGQVCPTGALQKLNLEEKHKFVMGKAYFDKNRCLPWAQNTSCIVCEEYCPVYDKAIKFREETVINHDGEEITLKRPYVVQELCIGCGTCENKCPLPGNAAVRVLTNEGAREAGHGYY